MIVFRPEALAELFELEDSSPGLVQTLFDDYVQTSLKSIESMQTANSLQDFKKLELESHSLKSSSRVLGLDRLADLCFEIEQLAHRSQSDTQKITLLSNFRTEAVAALGQYLNKRAA